MGNDITQARQKFRELVLRAIDGRTQKQFATDAGISQYGLCHMLHDDGRIPHKGTLRKIAAASRGKVSETQLFYVCGYDDPDITRRIANIHTEAECILLTHAIIHHVHETCDLSRKYDSVTSYLENIMLMSGMRNARIMLTQEHLYKDSGRNYAEKYVHCRISWMYLDYQKRYALALIMFFCKTEQGGYIMSDCAFDLNTLMKYHNPDACRLFPESSKEKVNYSEHPVVTWSEDDCSAEAKLMQAVFRNTDEDDEE